MFVCMRVSVFVCLVCEREKDKLNRKVVVTVVVP